MPDKGRGCSSLSPPEMSERERQECEQHSGGREHISTLLYQIGSNKETPAQRFHDNKHREECNDPQDRRGGSETRTEQGAYLGCKH